MVFILRERSDVRRTFLIMYQFWLNLQKISGIVLFCEFSTKLQNVAFSWTTNQVSHYLSQNIMSAYTEDSGGGPKVGYQMLQVRPSTASGHGRWFAQFLISLTCSTLWLVVENIPSKILLLRLKLHLRSSLKCEWRDDSNSDSSSQTLALNVSCPHVSVTFGPKHYSSNRDAPLKHSPSTLHVVLALHPGTFEGETFECSWCWS